MTEEDKNIKEKIEETKAVPAADSSSLDDSNSNKEQNDGTVLDTVSENSDKVEKVQKVTDNKDSEESIKLPFMIGTKIGMTQIFSDNGNVYPVTVIQAGPCNITQIKTIANSGYNAVQLGYQNINDNKITKPLAGHFKKASTDNKKHLKEFRFENLEDIKLGKEILLNQFDVGDMLTVTGTSKGKGFAGHMKRHNFSGGRASHGKNSVMRKAGSIGAGTSPGRVWKGTRMAGRMGNDTVTIKNLELVKLDYENNLLFISGSVPGANKNIVYISRTS